MALQRLGPVGGRRKEFRVELFVDAVDEKAVWTLLKQLKNVEGAGLIEEPIVEHDENYPDDEYDDDGVRTQVN